jgi:hypothetical protein
VQRHEQHDKTLKGQQCDQGDGMHKSKHYTAPFSFAYLRVLLRALSPSYPAPEGQLSDQGLRTVCGRLNSLNEFCRSFRLIYISDRPASLGFLDELPISMCGENDHSGFRGNPSNLSGGFQSVFFGHRDVQNCHVRSDGLRLDYGFLPVQRLAYYSKPRMGLQESFHRASYDRLIVGDKDLNESIPLH